MKSNYDSIDISKFILSFFVVSIHTMGKYGLYPIISMAVPIFFIISSYLFFSKYNEDNAKERLKGFVIRNLKLYFFWLLVLIVPLFYMWGYFSEPFSKDTAISILKYLIRFFYGSTFPASWYISALIISVSIICLLYKFLKPVWILAFTSVIYILCCIACSYRGLLSDYNILIKTIDLYHGSIYTSFPIGLFWNSIGLVLAKESKLISGISKKRVWLFSIISVVLLIAEHIVVMFTEIAVDYGCLFMLVPACVFTFILILKSEIELKDGFAKTLRNMSTVIYCVHGTIASALLSVLVFNNKSLTYYLTIFILTIIISMFISLIIITINKKTKIKIFKWAY